MARAESGRGPQAQRRRIRAAERWRGWRRHHSQSAADSLARVLSRPAASLLTWLVIGVALALPSGLWVVLDNVDRLGGSFSSSTSLSLFLAMDVEESAARELAAELAGRPAIRGVVFRSREQALQEFVDESGLGDLAAGLPDNPLPHVLILDPATDDGRTLTLLAEELAALPAIDEVVLDTLWLQRLQSIMALGRRGVQLLAGLLVAAVVLVLGNTIRLAIEARRDEIVITKLVGGSNAFVRRPLLYTGMWFGLGGGIVAALLVAGGTLLLRAPVATLAASYGSGFQLAGLGLIDSLQLVMLGAFLGLAGAWLAAARHLREIEPR
jgi:cell division transport system permease protein